VLLIIGQFFCSQKCICQPNSCEAEWQLPIQLSHDSVLAVSPSLSLDGSILHVIWYGIDTIGGLPFSGIQYSRTTDRGASFSLPLTIADPSTAFLPGVLSAAGGVVCITALGFADGSSGLLLFRSGDGGTTWDSTRLLLRNAAPNSCAAYDSSFFVNYTLLTDHSSGVIGSTDGGKTWAVLSTTAPPIQSLYVSNALFAGTGEFLNGSHNEIGYYYSPDQGADWIGPQTVSLPDAVPSTTSRLSVEGTHTVYVAWNDSGSIMFRKSDGTDDDGDQLFGGITLLSAEHGAVFPSLASSGPYVVVAWDADVNGTNSIRLRSSNRNASSFCPIDTPSTGTQPSAPCVVMDDSTIHLVWVESVQGSGEIMYRSGKLTHDLRPTSFSLMQNFPNPAAGTTKIYYGIPVPERVTLKLYNILGQCVATLVDDVQPAATYTVTVSTSGLASGVYFYRLMAYPFNEVRKLVVLH